MNIKPSGSKVFVKQIPEPSIASGIEIPDSAKRPPQRGTVIAVGNGTKDWDMQVRVGMTVYYQHGSYEEITIDGETFIILHDGPTSQILGWLE